MNPIVNMAAYVTVRIAYLLSARWGAHHSGIWRVSLLVEGQLAIPGAGVNEELPFTARDIGGFPPLLGGMDA
jgi:hypothetical protein